MHVVYGHGSVVSPPLVVLQYVVYFRFCGWRDVNCQYSLMYLMAIL